MIATLLPTLPVQANAWLVIFLGIWLQALPFLLLGTVISSALTAFVPPRALARFIPRRAGLAVPMAGLAGIALPACECASVPTTRSLVRAGVPTAAALTFMVASPAINPVVITATAIAYTMNPRMALARFVAGLLAAILIGLAWSRLGTRLRGVDEPDVHLDDRLTRPATSVVLDPAIPSEASGPQSTAAARSRGETFRAELVSDFITSAGYLVLGAAAAATIKVFVPTAWMDALTTNVLVESLVLAMLAVVVALCSEADAFMAVSLTSFSPTAQLAFLVIGPVVDVKLMAMEGGAFGAGFLRRFLPLAVVACLVSALLVGSLLLTGPVPRG